MTSVLPSVATGRVRYHFLDGVRGLAALYVLIFHSLTISVPQDGQDLSAPMKWLRSIFGYGHFAVAVFIVLSGFSLMLPLARNTSTKLRSGFWAYIGRRCRRVMPPYYAALVVSIIAILAASVVPSASADAADEALSAGSILSHVFLVHNWNSDWVFRINGPMWSVATEFQIYFLFPLVLLPLWRRVGAPATIAIAWAAPFAVHFLLPDDNNFSWAAPWFVGSFAAGMWASTVAIGSHKRTRCLTSVSWGSVSLGALAVVVVILAAGGSNWPLPILDAIVSVFAVGLILACMARHTNADQSDRGVGYDNGPSRLNRFFGSRSAVALGAFSYSLYVLQHPLLRLTEALLGELPVGFETVLWLQLIVGTPLIMAASRLFAEFFELPFTTGSQLLDALRRARSKTPATAGARP